MARKKSHKGSIASLSPINPSVHYLLFLILALLLVIVVAGIMQKTASDTRAWLMCPKINDVGDLARHCPEGVEYVKDENNCGVFVCKLPKTEKPKPSAPGLQYKPVSPRPYTY